VQCFDMCRGAGTEADVLIDFHGTNRSSGPCSLLSAARVGAPGAFSSTLSSTSASGMGPVGATATGTISASSKVAFERGGCDEFVLMLPSLGDLTSADVWLSQPDDPWHLSLLVVTTPTGEGRGSCI
jgi:hypothetical protein